MSENVNNYYQGVYVTETVLGNPNGDFIDNSPRNFNGNVFTTDKCIKFNVRKYIHENYENLEKNENVVFFYPRLVDGAKRGEAKFQTRDSVFKNIFDEDFNKLVDSAPDVRMFGGTFSFKDKDSKQIYGPIQLSYGIDLNDAQFKRLQIGAPFSTTDGSQKTTGSEYVVDDAIISYDISINPNNYPKLLKLDDLKLFNKSLWFGTNSRKSTSKKTDSKLLLLIKFKNSRDDGMVDAISVGELKQLLTITNKKERDMGIGKIKFDLTGLMSKLDKYDKYIDKIIFYYDEDEVELNISNKDKIVFKTPNDLL